MTVVVGVNVLLIHYSHPLLWTTSASLIETWCWVPRAWISCQECGLLDLSSTWGQQWQELKKSCIASLALIFSMFVGYLCFCVRNQRGFTVEVFCILYNFFQVPRQDFPFSTLIFRKESRPHVLMWPWSKKRKMFVGSAGRGSPVFASPDKICMAAMFILWLSGTTWMTSKLTASVFWMTWCINSVKHETILS